MKIVLCQDCPLRALPLFVEQTDNELVLIESLKKEQVGVAATRDIILECQADAPLYTLLSGWAFRYKTLSDGRRQILNFLLPGDFIGVQQKMGDVAAHGVQALTDVVLCVFQRDALWQLHRAAPSLAFDVTWLTAHEESMVDDALLSVGRRNAEERVAALLVKLFQRAAALLPGAAAQGVSFPLTQGHIADALGLSLVHTNKTLRKLERRGLHRIDEGRLYLLDTTTLMHTADAYGTQGAARRPLI
ncbi:MAG: Crp/Fnr family transcriptional regulator [Burkholderiaceae bacterium]